MVRSLLGSGDGYGTPAIIILYTLHAFGHNARNLLVLLVQQAICTTWKSFILYPQLISFIVYDPPP